MTPHYDKVLRPYYPKGTPYLGDLEKRATIALVNTNPVINYAESLPPNVIEVGGLQIQEPKKLPKDLQDFIDNSINGTVYISFGTNVKAEFLKNERIQIIIDVVDQLPQYNFLWKMDFDQTKYSIPKNLKIRNFFPQRDLFGHPKLKLFVTHSGALSTQESIWFGVPMIGVALFVDQPRVSFFDKHNFDNESPFHRILGNAF